MICTILKILGTAALMMAISHVGLDQQLRSIRDNASCHSCLHDKRKFSGLDRKCTELCGVRPLTPQLGV